MSFPLRHQPGTATQYSVCYSVLGAIISKALKMKNINLTSVEYCQHHLLHPAGITKAWFNYGQSQPPADAKDKLTSITITRSNKYGFTDLSYKKGNYIGETVWGEDVPNDSLTILAKTYLQNKDD